jgi:putative ABC transport system permease protein
MTLAQWWHTIHLGFSSLMLHKLRSGLTILGIIFGVASVITMLAVGEGASQESQERIKNLGSNNIIIESVKASGDEETGNNYVLKYGITHLDAQRILETIPGVKRIVPQRILNESVRFMESSKSAQVIGTLSTCKKISSLNVIKGRFLCEMDEVNQLNVCVISRSLANSLFTYQDPFTNSVKIANNSFHVVGIVNEQGDDGNSESLANCYIPLSTLKSRFGNVHIKKTAGSFSAEEVQLNKLIIEMENPAAVITAESQIKHLLDYAHKVNDFKMIVPLQLLKNAEATKRMFNIVLGSIAAISLIVGGIGVMNIMLATVTERTREIGLRRALGAKKKDIVRQFMVESVLLSLCGGLIGVIFGIGCPHIISAFTDMPVVVSPLSVLVAFGVSALIGLVFGIYPAAKSAQLDPIEALRNE